MKTILVTGSNGFIGSALIQSLFNSYNVITFDRSIPEKTACGYTRIKGDITDNTSFKDVLVTYKPDIIVHCAGIAHQKIGSISSEEYLNINSLSTECMALAALDVNPNVHFIFLSSISVYGEGHNTNAVTEQDICHPSSDYAFSKYDAENRLQALYNSGSLKKLDILRLAPVYDREWSLNLDRRVFAPKKLAYLRFGSGTQRMSALARPNLVAFVSHLLGQDGSEGVGIFNVCDAEAYSFSSIISIFKNYRAYPMCPMVPVPMKPVWLATRIAGMVFRQNRDWWHACYDKLSGDLVYDNRRMLATGFHPSHSLETIFKQSN